MQRILELVPLVRDETGLNVAVSAPASSPRTRPGASPRAACTATTTTSRRPGRSSPQVVTTHTWEERCGHLPAGPRRTAWSCAAASCSAWARPSPSASSCSAQLARARPDRGAAQLPQPPARHAARRSARSSSRSRPSAGSPCSAWPCPSVILRYAGGREVTLRELQAMGMTVGHQRPDRRQLPHHARPLARRGPADARRPAHADRRAHRSAVSRGDSPASGPGAHCPGCGSSDDACRGCLPALDPPRYCTGCGGWLTVRVSTGGWRARCRACGDETASR